MRSALASVEPVSSPPQAQQPEAGPSRKRRRETTESRQPSIKSPTPSPKQPQETQFESEASGDLWDAVQILDERGKTGSGQYLIQWEGVDPETGEAWKPTWERRRDVTVALAADWKEKKRKDPSVVGVVAKQMAEAQRAIQEAEKKRKLAEKEAQSRKKPRGSKSRTSLPKKKDVSRTNSPDLIEVPNGSAPVTSANADDADAPVMDAAPESPDQALQSGFEMDGLDDGVEQESAAEPVRAEAEKNGEPSTRKGKAKARVSAVEVVLPPQIPKSRESTTQFESSKARTRKVNIDRVPTTFGEAKEPEQSPTSPDDGLSTSQTPSVPETQVVENQTPVLVEDAPVDTQTIELETTESVTTLDTTKQAWITVTGSYLDTFGPVQVPTDEQFKKFLPAGQAGPAESLQSTTSIGPSQLDPIQSYNSPIRGPQAKDKGKERQTDKQTQCLNKARKNEKGQSKKASGSKAAPVIVKRYINGEEVLAVESDSSSTSDSEYQSPPIPVIDDVMGLDPILASVESNADSQSIEPVHLVVGEAVAQPAEPEEADDVVVETVETNTESIPAEEHVRATPSVMQSNYDLKIAEIAALQEQLSERQRLVDDLQEKVTLAETQVQTTTPAEPTVVSHVQISADPTESTILSVQINADSLPNGSATPAIETAESVDPVLAPAADAITSAIPVGTDAAAAPPAPAPGGVDAEELARLLAQKDAEIKKERIRAKRAERNNRETEQTLQFIRERYEEASTSAVREVNKVKELEEKVERLQDQLKFGLKQREMSSAALVTQHKTEISRLRGQLKILLDQNRLTNDTIRMRASAYHGLKDDIIGLETELKLTKAKNVDLSERNDELLGQVEFYRAREMGIIPPASDSNDEDRAYESDGTTSELSDAPPSPKGTNSRAQTTLKVIQTAASQLMPDTQDLASLNDMPTPVSAPVSATRTLCVDESIRQDIQIREQVYESPWTPGLYFKDEAEVKEHIMLEVDNEFA